MKRIWSLIAVLALAVGLLFAGSTPEKAEATVAWPLQIPSSAYGMNVASNGDDILFTDCGNGYTNGRITDDTTRYDPALVGSTLSCQSTTGTELVAKDGTAYLTHWDSSASVNQLVAVKNGRIKWSTDLTWAGGCSGNAWPWSSYNPESLSVGADGNVYFVAIPTVGDCPAYLVGINAYTGQRLSITHELGSWSWVGQIRPKVWTYSDYIIFIDAWNTKHVYGYDGIEDTAKQYEFTFNSNLYGTAYANKDGRVFAVIACGPGLIMYSDLNGGAGSISRTDCGSIANLFTVGPNGTIVSYHPLNGDIAFYDPATSSSSLLSLSTRDYGNLGYIPLYSDGVTNLKVDENSNVLATMTYSTNSSGSTQDTYIEYIDATTNTPSVLLSLYGDGTDANRPTTAGQTGLVNNGFLYSPVVKGYDSSGYLSYIYKTDVATAGFGTAVPQGPGFAEPTNKLEYVAMGDSFSSGEGVTPFIAGTDKSAPDENRCHRSEDAYPLLLEEDPDLNLNLTAFVACSGATTSNIAGTGQWNEQRQLSALSASTDVVTITIGGNNVGFKEFATACVIDVCGEGSSIYVSTINAIASLDDDLENVYQQILATIDTQGQLYVMNYPMMVPTDMEYGDLVNPLCQYLAGGTDLGIAYGSWDDARAAQDVIAHLNAKIEQVVYDMHNPRVHYVDVSSQFEDYDVCSINSQFIVNQLPPATFHPNGVGQQVLANTMITTLN